MSVTLGLHNELELALVIGRVEVESSLEGNDGRIDQGTVDQLRHTVESNGQYGDASSSKPVGKIWIGDTRHAVSDDGADLAAGKANQAVRGQAVAIPHDDQVRWRTDLKGAA
jgi:hypothetical protein